MKSKNLLFCLICIFFTVNVKAQLKVFSDGDISIGDITNAPPVGFKLHTYGNSLFSGPSFTGGTGSSAAFIQGNEVYSSHDNPDYTFWEDDKTGIFHPEYGYIGFGNLGTESMRLTNQGNLLIGGAYENTSRVKIDCEVDQPALATVTHMQEDYAYAHISYINNESTKNWAVNLNTEEEMFYVLGNGDVWSSTNYYSSDSTLKENITSLQNSSDKILQLRGVSYNFKQSRFINPLDTTSNRLIVPRKREIGLIAQEVEQVVPEVVATNDKGLKGIAYSNLVALLVEAFKEQNQTLDSLREQINECCAVNGISNRIKGKNNSNIDSKLTETARLDQNVPNPFYNDTKIGFYIPENTNKRFLIVFDMQGILLRQYPIENTGESFLNLSGNEYKAGMYMYSLVVDGKEVDTKRMILTR